MTLTKTIPKTLTKTVSLTGLLTVTGFGQTFVMDFDKDANGASLTAGSYDVLNSQPYADLYSSGSGVILSTNNPGSRPLNLYNTEGSGGLDPDLERGIAWATGNLGSTSVGNALIVNTNSNISQPNDWVDGGDMTFASDLSLQSFTFEFLDTDKKADGSVIVFDSLNNESATIAYKDFLPGSGSVHATPGIAYGNRSGNRVGQITASELGLAQFDQITFKLTNSGAVSNVAVKLNGDAIPEPTGAALLGVGLLAGLARRRRD